MKTTTIGAWLLAFAAVCASAGSDKARPGTAPAESSAAQERSSISQGARTTETSAQRLAAALAPQETRAEALPAPAAASSVPGASAPTPPVPAKACGQPPLPPGYGYEAFAAELRYAAGSMADGVVALREDIANAKRLKTSPPDVEQRLKALIQANSERIGPGEQKWAPTFTETATAAVEKLLRQNAGKKPEEMKDSLDKLAGSLQTLSEGKTSDPREFFDGASKQMGSLDFRPSTMASTLFSLGALAGVAGVAAYSFAHVAFKALPVVLSPHLLGSSLPDMAANVVPWATITVALSLLSVLAKETPKPNNPFLKFTKKWKLFALLPPMALLEEIVFRAGLTLGGAALLSLVMPVLPAILAASFGSSVLFARAHGYGQMVPRVIMGMVFSYLMLTHGLPFAAAVHCLNNAILLGIDQASAWIQKKTAQGAA